MEVKIFGEKPTLGLFSGVHGDEWKIIEPVKKIIEKYKEELQPFLYIPICSPSAVSQKTRINSFGNDINRSFIKFPTDKEVQEIITILQPYKFRLCADFHEDNECTGVYVYDNFNIEGSDILTAFRNDIKRLDIPLYSGIDDSSDEELGRIVHDGYRVSLPPEKDLRGNFIYDGFFDYWALIEEKTPRWLTLEVPTSLNQIQKESVVETFIQTFIISKR